MINGAELMTETGSLRFVVGLNALAAGYDANGNMTLRLKDGARYFLAYDAESRLTSVSGTVSASFVYNGDGQRVTATIGATITTYIGGYFEWQGSTGKSYYFAGGQRIAMRTGTEVKFLLGDHLGSTSVTALASGAFDTETRYYPWGGVRWASGTTPTDYRFTGQQEIASIGLYFYNSRFYDASLGRFISPDSIIPNPGDPVSFDHFAYVRNNPLKYSDPSGYFSEDQIKLFMGFDEDDPWEYVLRLFEEGGIYAGRWGWLETLRRAEIGDQISIEWAEGILPEGHPALDGPLTFGLDPQGNLILSGDGFFFGHKLAGLYGDQYNLVHYTDLSAFLCSPYQCGYTTGFSTAAVHDPYLHTRIKWEEFQNLGTDLELLEFISHAAVPAVMTGLLVAETIAVCTNPITCIAGVPPLLSGAYASGWATRALGMKTYEFFMNEYTEITP